MQANKEVDELKLRLKILEGQRGEDRERLKEMEKLKQELDTVASMKEKAQGKSDTSRRRTIQFDRNFPRQAPGAAAGNGYHEKGMEGSFGGQGEV